MNPELCGLDPEAIQGARSAFASLLSGSSNSIEVGIDLVAAPILQDESLRPAWLFPDFEALAWHSDSIDQFGEPVVSESIRIIDRGESPVHYPDARRERSRPVVPSRAHAARFVAVYTLLDRRFGRFGCGRALRFAQEPPRRVGACSAPSLGELALLALADEAEL